MSKSNRRSFIDLAEAVRTLNVEREVKKSIAGDLAIALRGEEGFDPNRFQEHALSDSDDAKWAYNRRTGEGPGQVGWQDPFADQGDVDDEDDDEDSQN